MAWGRLDDNYCINHKTVCVSLAARGLWVTLLSWACRNDGKIAKGFLPYALVKREGAEQTDELVAELVRVGFWEVAEGGFFIHDFEQYQAPARVKSDPVSPEELSAIRSEAGKRGAAKKWQNHGKPDGKFPDSKRQNDAKPDAKPDGKSDGKTIANPGNPVPVPDPEGSSGGRPAAGRPGTATGGEDVQGEQEPTDALPLDDGKPPVPRLVALYLDLYADRYGEPPRTLNKGKLGTQLLRLVRLDSAANVEQALRLYFDPGTANASRYASKAHSADFFPAVFEELKCVAAGLITPRPMGRGQPAAGRSLSDMLERNRERVESAGAMPQLFGTGGTE